MIKPTRQQDIKTGWHLIDAQNQILGRLSTRVVPLLIGKKKSYFTPHLDCGDHVVIINAADIKVTGKKAEEKKYYRYSGYPGGLKVTPFAKIKADKPAQIIEHAIKSMLPKNKLRDLWLAKLHVYPDAKHPYENQLAPVTAKGTPKNNNRKISKND